MIGLSLGCLHTKETGLSYSHRAKPVTERNEVERGAWRGPQGEVHGVDRISALQNERNEEKRGML